MIDAIRKGRTAVAPKTALLATATGDNIEYIKLAVLVEPVAEVLIQLMQHIQHS